MKKLLAFVFSCLIILLLSGAILFGLINTSYVTPIAQWSINLFWPNKIQFQRAEYDYPFHLRLFQPTVQLGYQPITFAQMDIWLNQHPYYAGKWHIDSILLDGANITAPLPSIDWSQTVMLHQLAMHNINLDEDDYQIEGLSLQVKNPQWNMPQQKIPFGELQLSAKTLHWQGEQFDQLLIDADYKQQDSTIYGFSFAWRSGQISGQAEQYPAGWSLVNVTVNHLDLSKSVSNQLQYKIQSLPTNLINHINSLDVLNSNISWQGIELINTDLSLEDVQLGSPWPYSGGVSAHADTLTWHGLQWVDPNLTLNFSPQTIRVSDFSAGFWQGNIQLSGDISPTDVHLTNLSAQGLKWYGEHQSDWQDLPLTIPNWRSLTIDHLSLDNVQLIQLAKQPFWQLTGLNIEGKNVQFMQNNQLGLWNGSLKLSANSASIGDTRTSQAILEMNSNDGIWQLSRAFLPFEHGYLDANAQWNFKQHSGPWQLNLHTDSVPIGILNQFVNLPFKFEAVADTDMQLSGLGGSTAVIQHTLNGKVSANLREGTLLLKYDNHTIAQPFELSKLQLTADRGRITIPEIKPDGIGFDATFGGSFDLADSKAGTWTLTDHIDNCQTVSFDIWHNTTQVNQCRKN